MAKDAIMQQSGVSMPGYAVKARQQLADHYDQEVASRLELARFAHEAGLKSTFQNLMQMVGRSRKFAMEARAREQLHAAMQPPPMPAQAPPAPNMVDQANNYAGSTWPQLGPSQRAFGQRIQGALGLGPGPAPPASVPHYACGTNMPRYQGGTEMPGTHPGGPALVGEQGPEVVDLPQGSRVTPNLMTIIKMLLDIYAQQQGGGAPMDDQGGAMDAEGAQDQGDVQDLPTTPMPHYAYGTTSYDIQGRRVNNTPPPTSGYSGPNVLGFIDAKGRFNANQGLQDIQLANANANNYSPLGNPAIAELAKQSILGGMGARQDAAARTADIYAAGDPAFRAYARLKAGADTQSEAARAYEQAAYNQAQSGQAFGRDVYLNQLGAVTRKDAKQPNQLAAIGGQLAGAGIGALVGGPAGAQVGAKAGGALSGTGTPASEPQLAALRPYDPNRLAWQT